MLYIFDWDGTLVNSAAKIVSCMQVAIDELNLPYRDDDAVRNIIGLGLPEAIRTLYNDIEDSDLEQLREGYSRHWVAADQVPCNLFDGVEETLDELLIRGHQLAVATGKSRRGLNRALGNNGLESLFHASRCADETRSKPHPQMLHELLEELRVEACEAVMVGDTEYDLEMATNASVSSIAVSYGAHAVERLERHAPLLTVDRFVEIADWDRERDR